MKRRLKSLIAAVLILSMGLALSACGEKSPETPAKAEGMVYRAMLTSQPGKIQRAVQLGMYEDEIYVLGKDPDGEGRLYYGKLPDGEFKEMELKETREEAAGLNSVLPTEDKVYVFFTANDGRGLYCEYISTYDRKSGERLSRKLIQGLAPSEISCWCSLGDAIIGLHYDGSLVSLSPEHGISSITEAEPCIASLMKSGEKLYALSLSEDYSSAELYEVINGSCELKKCCDIPDTGLGGEDCHFMGLGSSVSSRGLYLVSQDSVAVLDAESGSVEPLFTFKEAGIENVGEPTEAVIDKDGAVYMTEYYSGLFYKIALTEQIEKKKLTVSCGEGVGTTYLSEAVTRFNLSNPEYEIEFKMYPYENPELVLTELAAGEMPDVFYIGSTTDMESVFRYIRVNDSLFEDLSPYIENDGEISREDFVPGVLESVERDGKISGLPVSMGVYSIAAPKSLAESLDEWSVDKLIELNENLPEGVSLFNEGSREWLLDTVADFASAEYVDYKNGSCNFENENFGKWLELCKNFEPYDYNNSKGYLFYIGQVGHNVPGIMRMDTKDDYAYIGWPGEKGPVNLLCNQSGSFSIMKSSENKEAAWEFIKLLLSPVLQNGTIRNFGYPVMEEAFDSDTNKVYRDEDPQEVKTDARRLKEAFSKCSAVVDCSVVNDIIMQECTKYFADQQSLEDTLRLIQSRAGIYLAEQK